MNKSHAEISREGGLARAKSMSAKKRSESARKAALARHAKAAKKRAG